MDRHIPKYLKEHYDIYTMNSFKDVPGWINDAEFIYPQMVEQAQDGDHFVEIGTLLGQNNINIASYILSREIKEKLAYAIVKVDEKIETTLIDQIASLDEIITVDQLELK